MVERRAGMRDEGKHKVQGGVAKEEQQERRGRKQDAGRTGERRAQSAERRAQRAEGGPRTSERKARDEEERKNEERTGERGRKKSKQDRADCDAGRSN